MNYYDIFGISPTATPEDINATHKALAKKYHPDVNNSKDAHEKMTMLNEAHEVLSDTSKRERYDNELRRSRQYRQGQGANPSQNAETGRTRGVFDAGERAGKAEQQRMKAEARMKADEAMRKQRMEQARRRAEEAVNKSRQVKSESDKQSVIKELSAIVMGDNARRLNKMDVDDERYYATKVLLSMIRNDNTHLRRMTEEAERKKRVEEMLRLVNEINEKKEWV